MSEEAIEWLRCHGIGRDRMVRLLSEYLQELGYSLEESMLQGEVKATSVLNARLSRPNPAVPPSLSALTLKVAATGSGCFVYWEAPRVKELEGGMEKPGRFTTEMVAHMVRVVSTSSRGAAKVTESAAAKPPFLVR